MKSIFTILVIILLLNNCKAPQKPPQFLSLRDKVVLLAKVSADTVSYSKIFEKRDTLIIYVTLINKSNEDIYLSNKFRLNIDKKDLWDDSENFYTLDNPFIDLYISNEDKWTKIEADAKVNWKIDLSGIFQFTIKGKEQYRFSINYINSISVDCPHGKTLTGAAYSNIVAIRILK
jgi:hypothetical protein